MDWNPEDWERSKTGLSADDVLYGQLRTGTAGMYSGLDGRIQLPDLSLPDPETAKLEDAFELYMIIATIRMLAGHDPEAAIPTQRVTAALKRGIPGIFLDPDPQSSDATTSSFAGIREIFKLHQQLPELTQLKLDLYQWDTVFHAMDVHAYRGAGASVGQAKAICMELHQRLCGYDLSRRDNHLHCGTCGGTFERSELPGIYDGHWACGDCLWAASKL